MGTRPAASLLLSAVRAGGPPGGKKKWTADVQQQPTQEFWMESKY